MATTKRPTHVTFTDEDEENDEKSDHQEDGEDCEMVQETESE